MECSARVVAVVDTKDRLGKVDGRYPHWVAPYDGEEGEEGGGEGGMEGVGEAGRPGRPGRAEEGGGAGGEGGGEGIERFSLIYYQTAGTMLPVGPAVFSVPKECCY